MEVHVTPETAKKLKDLAATSGRAPEDIVEDALAGYLEEVASVRETLDSRYDNLKSGRVKPIDGEEAIRKLSRDRLPRCAEGRIDSFTEPPADRRNMRTRTFWIVAVGGALVLPAVLMSADVILGPPSGVWHVPFWPVDVLLS